MVLVKSFETKPYEILKLDSELFGFKVARLMVERLDAETLAQHLTELSEAKVRLVFSKIAKLDRRMIKAARAAGGQWVGDVVEMECDLDHTKAQKASRAQNADSKLKLTTPESWSALEPLEREVLRNLAPRLTVYSHLGLDPKLDPSAVLKIFEIWIENSFNRKASDEVLVARLNKIVGFISFWGKAGAASSSAKIELLAIDKKVEGQHVASGLLDKALAMLRSRDFHKAHLATQANNIPALRLYTSRGFSEVRRLSDFHFWLA